MKNRDLPYSDEDVGLAINGKLPPSFIFFRFRDLHPTLLLSFFFSLNLYQ